MLDGTGCWSVDIVSTWLELEVVGGDVTAGLLLGSNPIKCDSDAYDKGSAT